MSQTQNGTYRESDHNRIANINRARSNAWHPGGLMDWSPTDWGCALAGEAGELCNVLKKLRRLEDGAERTDRGTELELVNQAAQEIGDTYLYLDLLAQRLGLNLYACVVDTFNRVSVREDLPHRLE